MALLGKWMWRFMSEKWSLWVRVLESNYGDILGGGLESVSKGRLGRMSGWWREIVKITVGPEGGWFNRGLVRMVGDGEITFFWRDVWIGDEPLRLKFTDLFELSLEKEGKEGSMGVWNGEYWVWDWKWKWSRYLIDYALNMLSSLISLLNKFTPNPRVMDRWKWISSLSGRYITKEAYNYLMARHVENQLPNDFETGFRILWNKLAPLKVVDHAWRLLWNRLPTKDNLVRRNILQQHDDLRCVFCSAEEENAQHVFFECPLSYSIWMEIMKWLNITTVIGSNVASNLSSFVFGFRGKRGKLIATCLWLGIVCLLWKWRNDTIFRNLVPSNIKLIEELKARTWSWLVVKDKATSRFSFIDWISNPRMVIESTL